MAPRLPSPRLLFHLSSTQLQLTPPLCSLQILAEDGVPGFYRGCVTNLLRTTPAAAVTFTSFELINRELRLWAERPPVTPAHAAAQQQQRQQRRQLQAGGEEEASRQGSPAATASAGQQQQQQQAGDAAAQDAAPPVVLFAAASAGAARDPTRLEAHTRSLDAEEQQQQQPTRGKGQR